MQKMLKEILTRVREGKLGVEEALERLAHLPYEDLGFAKPDTHRALRRGFPEVILGEGKTPDQVVGIARKLGRPPPASSSPGRTTHSSRSSRGSSLKRSITLRPGRWCWTGWGSLPPARG